MKTILRFCVLFLLMISYTSCDKIDELTEVDFNTTINENLIVTVQDGENVFTETRAVNMVNSDTQDYMDLLEDVDITSFKYRIINFIGDDEGTIVGSFQADGQILVTHDIVVSDAVGTDFEVTDVSTLNTIAGKLKNGEDVLFALTGTSICSPDMTFTIEMTIGLAITADVL